MKKYTSIDAKALEATLHRMRDALANGNQRLSFEMTTKDGQVKSLMLRAGEEEIQIDGTYSNISFAEVERPIGWMTTVTFTGKAAKLLEAHRAKVTLTVTERDEDADESSARAKACETAKAFLKELENRYKDVARIYEDELAHNFDLGDTTRFKIIGNARVPMDYNGKPLKGPKIEEDMPF